MASLEHVSPVERLRVRAGLSQIEVAERAGVDLRTLRYIEHGDREPRMPVLGKLAVLFGVDAAELLDEIRAWRGGRRRIAA